LASCLCGQPAIAGADMPAICMPITTPELSAQPFSLGGHCVLEAFSHVSDCFPEFFLQCTNPSRELKNSGTKRPGSHGSFDIIVSSMRYPPS
jgi:hypothetical protein